MVKYKQQLSKQIRKIKHLVFNKIDALAIIRHKSKNS